MQSKMQAFSITETNRLKQLLVASNKKTTENATHRTSRSRSNESEGCGDATRSGDGGYCSYTLREQNHSNRASELGVESLNNNKNTSSVVCCDEPSNLEHRSESSQNHFFPSIASAIPLKGGECADIIRHRMGEPQPTVRTPEPNHSDVNSADEGSRESELLSPAAELLTPESDPSPTSSLSSPAAILPLSNEKTSHIEFPAPPSPDVLNFPPTPSDSNREDISSNSLDMALSSDSLSPVVCDPGPSPFSNTLVIDEALERASTWGDMRAVVQQQLAAAQQNAQLEKARNETVREALEVVGRTRTENGEQPNQSPQTTFFSDHDDAWSDSPNSESSSPLSTPELSPMRLISSQASRYGIRSKST